MLRCGVAFALDRLGGEGTGEGEGGKEAKREEERSGVSLVVTVERRSPLLARLPAGDDREWWGKYC